MTYTNCDLILSVKDAEDHEKWLKTRDLGIGGSDAAVIMGMNSYKSPYQLWMEKTGQVEPPDLSGNQYVYWGTKNEANIADWFQEETGKKVKRLGTLQSREYPFMLANVDRTVIGENAGLEIKTAGILLSCLEEMKPSGSGLSVMMRTSRHSSQPKRNSGIWCRPKPRRPWMAPFPAPRHWLPDMLTAVMKKSCCRKKRIR